MLQKVLHVGLKRLYWDVYGAGARWLKDMRTRVQDGVAARRAGALPRPDIPHWLGERAFEHVRTVVEMGPRYPGSNGWRRQLRFLHDTLADLGLPAQQDRWLDIVSGAELENVWGNLPGAHPDRIVIGAHHDTKQFEAHSDSRYNFRFVGANDGASGVGLLLSLAEALRDIERQATIEFVFFDGEECLAPDQASGQTAFRGSRRFVAREQEKIREGRAAPIRAMLLLDMVGARNLNIDDERQSDRRLHRIFRRAVTGLGYQRQFFRHRRTVGDDHVPFLQAGIPALDLVQMTDNPQWHTADDDVDNVSAESLGKVGEVVFTALPTVQSEILRYGPSENHTGR
jgi:hypothetical protein